MRTLILALGFAAIAATPAFAQTARGTSSAAGAGTTGNATTGTTTVGTTGNTAAGTPRVVTGTTFNTANTTAGTTTTGTSTTTTDTGRENVSTATTPVTAQGNTTVPAGGATTGFGTNVTTDVNAATPGSSFAQGGPFSNDSGNSALGISPGQSSSGTLAGNSSSGLGADSTGLNSGIGADSTGLNTGVGADNTGLNRGVGVFGAPSLVPDSTVSVIGGGSTGASVIAVPAINVQQAPRAGTSTTPLFDQVAREGVAKEARRRARGEEPRIYGIAPNTERDLTWQMPDDPIIRY